MTNHISVPKYHLEFHRANHGTIGKAPTISDDSCHKVAQSGAIGYRERKKNPNQLFHIFIHPESPIRINHRKVLPAQTKWTRPVTAAPAVTGSNSINYCWHAERGADNRDKTRTSAIKPPEGFFGPIPPPFPLFQIVRFWQKLKLQKCYTYKLWLDCCLLTANIDYILEQRAQHFQSIFNFSWRQSCLFINLVTSHRSSID